MIAVELLLRRVKNVTKELADRYRQLAIEEVGPVSCHAGCAFCCYQKIVSGVWEGIQIYLHLKSRGEWTPELRQKLVDADREQTAHTHRSFLMAHRPCPFLAEESFGHGRCTIYPVRPISCAATFSVDDPKECITPDGANTFGIREEELDRRASTTQFALIRRLGKWRLVASTLPASVLIAEADVEGLPEPEVRTISLHQEGGPGSIDREFDKVATIEDGSEFQRMEASGR